MKVKKLNKLSQEGFKEIFTLNSQIAHTFLRSALEFFEDKKYDDCIKPLDKAIKIEPSNGVFNTLKLIFLVRLKKYKAALKLLNIQIRVEPHKVVNYCDKIVILMDHLKEFEKSLKVINTGLSYDEKNKELLTRKVNCLRILKKYKEALEVLDNCIAQYPNQAEFYIEKCKILLVFLEDDKKALRTANKGISINPDEKEIYIIKIHILLGKQEVNRALGLVKCCIEKFPRCFEIHELNHTILLIKRKFKEMLIAIESSIVEFPKHSSKLLISKAFILGFIFNRFEEAIENVNKVLNLSPDSEKANSLKNDLMKLQIECRYSQLYI